MGHITAPFGIKGWVKIQADTEYPDSLLDYPRLFVGREGAWRETEVLAIEARPKGLLVAQFQGCDDRDQAFALRGQLVAIPRAALPETTGDEFYWADLMGMQVKGIDDVPLGRVDHLLSTGANDVLVVRADDGSERLIPFVAAFVLHVDREAGVISTAWGLDY